MPVEDVSNLWVFCGGTATGLPKLGGITPEGPVQDLPNSVGSMAADQVSTFLAFEHQRVSRLIQQIPSTCYHDVVLSWEMCTLARSPVMPSGLECSNGKLQHGFPQLFYVRSK